GNIFYILPDYFATGEATAIDNCTDPVTLTTQSPAAGTPLSDGTYTISFTATDEYGNTSTCDFELIVESVLGISDNGVNMGSVLMYPNPAKYNVTIGNPQSLSLEKLDIFDIRGRVVKTIDLRNMGSEQVINVSELAAATYIVIIEGENGQITKRLIKE
ncbi:T9SS type A sorting domain-containing protein, partial [Aequorivita sp. F47161]